MKIIESGAKYSAIVEIGEELKKIEFGELQLGHTARSNIKACISSEWVSSGRNRSKQQR